MQHKLKTRIKISLENIYTLDTILIFDIPKAFEIF